MKRTKAETERAKQAAYQSVYHHNWTGTFEFRNLAPSFIDDKVCQCPTGKYELRYIPRTHKMECTSCRKPPLSQYFICSACGSHFIKDFSHPNFCVVDSMCWDCLMLDYEPADEDYMPCGHYSTSGPRLIAPPIPVDITNFDPFEELAF